MTTEIDVDADHGSRGRLDPAVIRRAPRISQSDVVQAADALLLEGHRPTIDRVRMLGGGSPNTIQEHLDVWWAHLGSRLGDVPGREFPELPERLQTRIDALEAAVVDRRSELDSVAKAYSTDRTKMEDRHAATEARWLNEVDRARQAAKETAKEQERQGKELRTQIGQLHTQRDELKHDLHEARAELRTAANARMQPEKRLAAAQMPAKGRRNTRPKPKVRPKPQNTSLRSPRLAPAGHG